MTKGLFTALLIFITICPAKSQTLVTFADSIRKACHIPELAYAVISSDTIYEMQALGYKRANSLIKAGINDQFRIGSNTKAITGFIAALLVKDGKITWNTKFFGLFPELKATSNTAYYNVTLLDLLTFRTQLFPYTYTYKRPKKSWFTGSEEEQRYQFTKWFLTKKPVSGDSVNFSNLGYVAAALMLEKASGKPYKELVKSLGNQLSIDFEFGQPNNLDSLQPWGHDKNLEPEPPQDNYKLNWLQAAGNICVSLPGYAKFIQLQLRGLTGRSGMLTASEFNFLHSGLNEFAVGWFWDADSSGHIYSYNIGNPGTFLSYVYVYKNADRAYILFSNAQTDDAEIGLTALLNELKRRYQL